MKNIKLQILRVLFKKVKKIVKFNVGINCFPVFPRQKK